jgi:hypothetical protein
MACKPKAARRGPKNEVYKFEGNLVSGNTGDQNGVFNVGNENSGCSRVADDDHEEDEAPSKPKAASSGPENVYYEVKGNQVAANKGENNGVFNVSNKNSGRSRVADDDDEEDEAPSKPNAARSGPRNIYYKVAGNRVGGNSGNNNEVFNVGNKN